MRCTHKKLTTHTVHNLEIPLGDNNNDTAEVQDDRMDERSDHSESKAEDPTSTSEPGPPTPAQNPNPIIPVCVWSHLVWSIGMPLTHLSARWTPAESAANVSSSTRCSHPRSPSDPTHHHYPTAPKQSKHVEGCQRIPRWMAASSDSCKGHHTIFNLTQGSIPPAYSGTHYSQ